MVSGFLLHPTSDDHSQIYCKRKKLRKAPLVQISDHKSDLLWDFFLGYKKIADMFDSNTKGKYDVACMPNTRKSREEGNKSIQEQQCAIGVTEEIVTVSLIWEVNAETSPYCPIPTVCTSPPHMQKRHSIVDKASSERNRSHID